MQIILKEDVQGLGYKDDVVEVKDGYGRNYLIPQGKAVIATPSALKVLAENQRQRAHKLAKIKADAEALAAALATVQLTIPAKVSETGTIYGSVNNVQGNRQIHRHSQTSQRSQRRHQLRSRCRRIIPLAPPGDRMIKTSKRRPLRPGALFFRLPDSIRHLHFINTDAISYISAADSR